MGIFIYMNISKSVTAREWKKVYEETLELINYLPLAEYYRVDMHGTKISCLAKTQEREYVCGSNNERHYYGWTANGDMDVMKTAEDYFLPRDLVCDDDVDSGAGDAMLVALPSCLGYDYEDKRFNRVYHLWGGKTQGEPYHIYLLAVACLIESRLGEKAFFDGDITRGQCRKAVEIANRYLKIPIDLPDRCCTDRILKRINGLDLSDGEKLKVFESLYLGTKDAEFGETMRKSFSDETIDAYWKDVLRGYEIGSYGFGVRIGEYLLWGFGIDKLCEYVNFEDKDGNLRYKEFVIDIMNTKLHLKDKNCADPLKIDQEQEQPYSIWTLFAQFGFAGARNKKVDRYVPIEEIRAALKKGLAGRFDAAPVIDEYLEEESKQIKINLKDINKDMSEEQISEIINQDRAEAFGQAMNEKRERMKENYDKYDICDYDELIFYEKGDSIYPQLAESVGNSRKTLDSLLTEPRYTDLSSKTAAEQFRWLAAENRYILIRDTDWEKVYNELAENADALARYYPMVRVRADSEGLRSMLRALVINDELYLYSKELADSIESKEKA